MSRTFLATLQFDGTDFVGWQRQPVGRSVQAEFERVLERLFGRPTVAHAAGRTDAGVHALALGVSFSAPDSWATPALRRALNALLPRDCWVQTLSSMRPGFHARKSALARRYRYLLGLDDAAAAPFRHPFEWALCRPVDQVALCSAATLLLGEHDFTAFAAKGSPKPHYLCHVRQSDWTVRPEGRGLTFEVEADRFLHHMVRMLVGTMVDIGLGRRPLSDIEMLLERRDNQETGPPAPPQGLYFLGATYPIEAYAGVALEDHAAIEPS